MAIDAYNIYVCGASGLNEEDRHENQSSNPNNNWIIKLPRNKFSYFRDQPNGYEIEPDDPNTTVVEGYTTIYPILRSTGEDYTFTISYITKYNSNKSFIIGYKLPTPAARNAIGNDIAFTTANLEIIDGEEKLVINDSPNDVFVIQNNVQFANATKQDICYSSEHGLFIPIWYGKPTDNQYTNANKNVIMWVDLSTSNNSKLSTITLDGVTYRYYTQPDKINVNQSNKGYSKFEVESIAITVDGDMLFSANVKKASGQQGELTNIDSVFKLTHDNGQQFVLQWINTERWLSIWRKVRLSLHYLRL